jgi:antitoxin (DNA-binding transcriptional repressor) of toxin-antitoxin stability system
MTEVGQYVITRRRRPVAMLLPIEEAGQTS